MDLQQLKHDSIILEWIDNINAAKHTERSYLQSMQQYTEYTKLSPSELIQEAEQEILSGTLTRQRKLKGYLISFRKNLKDKGLADKTIQTRLAAVKSFYESADITMPKLKGERRKAATLEYNNKVPSRSDLKECLKVCDPLEKAVMLTGISSGLAANEIRALKLKDFKDGYDPDSKITTLHTIRQKTNTRFTTFLSPECSQAVWDYLAWRDRELKAEGQKRQKQVEKQRTTEDSYLFVVRSVPTEYLTKRNEDLRKLSENSVIKMYRSISAKARKNTKSGTYNAVRSHTMRKWFSSVLIAAGCNNTVKEYWMGHSLTGTEEAYFAVTTEDLKNQYAKFVPYLTIQETLNVTESPDYQKIKDEKDDYKALAYKYFANNIELLEQNYMLKIEKGKTMTTEEKKQELIKWAINSQPVNESEEKMKVDLKKIFHVE